MLPSRLLASHAVFRPGKSFQSFRGNRLLAGVTDSVIPCFDTIQRFFDHPQLHVIQAVQPQGDELVVRNLRLVFSATRPILASVST